MDFKGQWAMLMGILPDGAGAADMLCRVLVAIDEDIVSLDIPRSPDGIKASMDFKVPSAGLSSTLSQQLLVASLAGSGSAIAAPALIFTPHVILVQQGSEL